MVPGRTHMGVPRQGFLYDSTPVTADRFTQAPRADTTASWARRNPGQCHRRARTGGVRAVRREVSVSVLARMR